MKYIVVIGTMFLICSCISTQPPAEPFTVNLRGPRQGIGSVESYLDKVFSSKEVSKNDINVFYYPADDAVGLEYKVQIIECSLFWNESGREAFIGALERYKKEFDQRTLVNRGKKSRVTYGSTDGFLTWKKTRFSVQAYGNAKVYLGYQFKADSVFFTVTQMAADYKDPNSRSRNQTSQITMVYFTLAQAESLAALLKEEHLNTLKLPEKATGTTGTTGTAGAEFDKY
jgi:hypothetical protein